MFTTKYFTDIEYGQTSSKSRSTDQSRISGSDFAAARHDALVGLR